MPFFTSPPSIYYMPGNFNKIAWCYDALSHLVYGRVIRSAQIDMLSYIPAGAAILIVGGGTGWIVEEISKNQPTGLCITYIDSSSRMIALAEKKNNGANKVVFITALIEELELSKKYDVIITPFLFDMFLESKCQTIVKKLDNCFKPNGLWLYSDFYCSRTSPLWQKALLRFMYFFFKISCHIEANQLPNIHACFLPYQLVLEKTYCRGFIKSKIFKNNFNK